MNKAAYIASFVCGTIVGAVVMSIYRDKKNLQKYKEESDISETTAEIADEVTISQDEVIDQLNDDICQTSIDKAVEINEIVNDIIHKNGYSVGDHTNDGVDDGPYVIGPADFGDFEDYDAISMTLLSDGILVDDRMITVDDPENSVGTNYKNYFGVYPNDPNTVYIRNDELCCDFEIVKDLRTYEEVDAQRPHLRWSDDE